MRALQTFLAIGTFATVGATLGQAGIVGGPHDFTKTLQAVAGANASSLPASPCQYCHVGRSPTSGADATGPASPLWNHQRTANSTYVTYDRGNSSRFQSLHLSLSLGSSMACLSCHDGSIAINQLYASGTSSRDGAAAGSNRALVPAFAVETASRTSGDFDSPASGNAGPQLGRNDLTHMHPVGVSYPAALAQDPTLRPLPAKGTVFAQMLKGPNRSVECTSCHDIHGTIGDSGRNHCSLIVDLDRAELCETCHQQ